MEFPGTDPSERSERPRPRLGRLVAPATLVWLCTIAGLFGTAWTATPWFDQPTPAQEARSDAYMQAFVIAVPLGLLVIAAIAGIGRRPVTGVVYLALALVLGLLLASQSGVRDRFRPESPAEEPEPPGYCIERSGGDNTCPGG
jgi:hypothetical protein